SENRRLFPKIPHFWTEKKNYTKSSGFYPGKTATSGGFSRKNFYLIIRISICNHAEFLVYWIGYFRRAGDTGPGRLFRRRTAGPEWAAGRGAFRPDPLPPPPRPTYGKTSSIIT